MSAKKSIVTFFQKQAPLKRLLESTQNLNTSTDSAEANDTNKENEKDEIKTKVLIILENILFSIF